MNYTLEMELPHSAWFVDPSTPRPSQPTPATQDPKTLIAHALAGDKNACNQLIMSTQGFAYHMAYRVLQCQHSAADAVQEAFIKAFRALPTYKGGNFRSWFLRILMNTCYDLLRVQKRRAATSLDDLPIEPEEGRQWTDPLEQPEAYVERMELRHWLERGIDALPLDQRIVVVLFDVEGYSYQEIGEITGAPIGTVKSRLSRGRTQLRNFLLRHKAFSSKSNQTTKQTRH